MLGGERLPKLSKGAKKLNRYLLFSCSVLCILVSPVSAFALGIPKPKLFSALKMTINHDNMAALSDVALSEKPSNTEKDLEGTSVTTNTSFHKVEKGKDIKIVRDLIGDKMGAPASHTELIWRRIRVFYAATRLFADYKLVQYRCDRISDQDDEDAKNAIWDAAHERNARFLYRSAVYSDSGVIFVVIVYMLRT